MEAKSFEDLDVWKKAKDLVVDIYQLTSRFPKDETFGFTSQIKRASLSVTANIAEGFGRFHYLDRSKFYLNARGSLFELKSHLLGAADLGFVDKASTRYIIKRLNDLGIRINNLIIATKKTLVNN